MLVVVLASTLHSQTPLEVTAQAKKDEAYRIFQTGDLLGAKKAAEEALCLTPVDSDMQRLKLDALTAMGSLEEAESWASTLIHEAPLDGELRLARAMLRQSLGKPQEAIKDAQHALTLASLSQPRQVIARLTLADLFLEGKHYQEALGALGPLHDEDSFPIQSRLGYALLGADQAGAAQASFRKAMLKATTPDDRRSALSGLLDAARRNHDGAAELQALHGLRLLDPNNAELAKEEGYAQVRAGMDAEALAAFKAALRPSSTSEDFLDAAYAAKRIGRNQEARNYFAKAIEALPPNKPVDPAQRFGLRREVESLSRTWGASLGTDYHQGGILPGFTNNQKVVQQGAEVYYQPEFLTSRGRMVQFYVQGFENLYDAQGGATGGPTLQPSIGLRAKPFESQNLVLAAQRLFMGGRYTQQDWLLRVAYSADRGTDLQAGASAWTYWQVYTEGAYFIDAKRYIHTLEARWGGSWRLGPLEGLVATPHLVLAGDFDNQNVQRTSSGLGAGLALRQWFRQNKTMAPASWAEFSIQYRAKLGNADRGGGFFARLSFWF